MAFNIQLEEGGTLVTEEGGAVLLAQGIFMSVDQFLQELYNDELSDMFIGNRNSKEEPRDKLLPLMNTGMRLAYAKFKIKFETVQLQVLSNVASYTLPQEDILAITRVVNSYGRELTTDEVVILGQTLMFPVPETVELQVEYKARPVRFTVEQDDEETPVELPDMLVDWLRPYVASRYLASMKTEAAVAKSQDFKLQAGIAEQVFIDTNTTNEFTAQNGLKLSSRGFA